MKKPVRNKSASVAARLRKIAETSKTTYEHILLRYGQERLLWRMANSKEYGNFILKGASLFLVWQGRFYRTTRDIDFLGSGSPDLERMKRIFMSLCDQNTVEMDGLVFDAASVRTGSLQDNQDYFPIALTEAFYKDPVKTGLWNGFSQRAGLTIPLGKLSDVVLELRKNLLPILDRITSDHL